MTNQSPWLNAEQAADYLRCSPDTIRNHAHNRRIPSYKSPNGKDRLFKAADLDAYMELRHVEAING